VLTQAWKNNLQVAAHVIGDEAAHFTVSTAHKVKLQGVNGVLHLEHAEILRPETLELMKSLQVVCHLQPCQWLSDQKWLKEKIGAELYGFSFPWRRLQEANITFDFGSDTPIEPPSVTRTLQGLDESAASGIPKLLGMGQSYLSHKDLSWAPNTFTIYENGHATQVVFRGDHLL
jgi:predicted amidohydrolase YtcJ